MINNTIKRPEWLRIINEYLERYYFNDMINWSNFKDHVNILKIRREIEELYEVTMSYTLLKKYVIHLIKEHEYFKKYKQEIIPLDLGKFTELFMHQNKISNKFDDLKQLLKSHQRVPDILVSLFNEIKVELNELGFVLDQIDFDHLHTLLKLWMTFIKNYSHQEMSKYYEIQDWDEIFE